MGFESFRVELRGGRAKYLEADKEIRALPNVRLDPDAGLMPAKLSDLKGGDAKRNAAAIREVLASAKTPLRDIAVLNAAAALIVAGKAPDLLQGAALAARSIDSGAAKTALDRLIAITNAG